MRHIASVSFGKDSLAMLMERQPKRTDEPTDEYCLKTKTYRIGKKAEREIERLKIELSEEQIKVAALQKELSEFSHQIIDKNADLLAMSAKLEQQRREMDEMRITDLIVDELTRQSMIDVEAAKAYLRSPVFKDQTGTMEDFCEFLDQFISLQKVFVSEKTNKD